MAAEWHRLVSAHQLSVRRGHGPADGSSSSLRSVTARRGHRRTRRANWPVETWGDGRAPPPNRSRPESGRWPGAAPWWQGAGDRSRSRGQRARPGGVRRLRTLTHHRGAARRPLRASLFARGGHSTHRASQLRESASRRRHPGDVSPTDRRILSGPWTGRGGLPLCVLCVRAAGVRAGLDGLPGSAAVVGGGEVGVVVAVALVVVAAGIDDDGDGVGRVDEAQVGDPAHGLDHRPPGVAAVGRSTRTACRVPLPRCHRRARRWGRRRR